MTNPGSAIRPGGCLVAALALLLIGCAGTRAQRAALRTLEPLPLPVARDAGPTQPATTLSTAARQIDALVNLKPIR